MAKKSVVNMQTHRDEATQLLNDQCIEEEIEKEKF